MKPSVYLDGRVTLIHGDCLKHIGNTVSIAHHIITDPPYEEHMHRSKGYSRKDARGNPRGHKVYHDGKRPLRTDGHANPRPVKFKSILGIRDKTAQAVANVCDGWFITFCTPEGIAPWRDAIEGAGLRYKRACFWIKPDSAPQFNGQGPAFAVEPFVTAWCGGGFSRWNGGGRRNYFEHNTNNADRQGDHETEKPVSLMIELVRLFTKPGDIVLDPFMGSGTTALACIAEGRRFIGIERDPKYFKLARARVEAAFMGRDEAQRHIIRRTGRVEKAKSLPLFSQQGEVR